MQKEKPSLVIKREEPEPHYEVHYLNRVEYWNLEMTKKIAQSKVYEVSEVKGKLHVSEEAFDENVEEFGCD